MLSETDMETKGAEPVFVDVLLLMVGAKLVKGARALTEMERS